MRKLITMLLLLTTVCLTLNGLAAQQLAATTTPLAEVERLQLPPLDNKQLRRAELSRRAPGIAPRFAETIDVNVSPNTHGTWEISNGTAVWRLRVPSPGAKSLNFGFDQYQMPEGGQLMLYTPDGSLVQGPFTPADNEEHEELWTPAISGDELVIEVSLPADRQDELRLHLKSVNHDFLGFADTAAGIMSGSCNLDVVCGEADGWGIVDGYRDIIQSVAVISTGGTTFCTGFLVSNIRQDCTPFFMTANHCGIGNGNAPSLVVYWNYINSVCRQPNSPASGGPGDGALADFNTGSIFRAGYSSSDMVLVELDDPVSETANAWFAGWNASEELEQDTIIAIHHPSTDEKRISFEFDGSYVGSWGTQDTPMPGGTHLIIADWDIGTTEGGSSGSPIFNSNKQVIGQLHGGAASCSNDAYDSYGWFHTSWEGGGTPNTRLRDWLDPDNTGLLEIPGRAQLQCSFFAGATPAVQTLCAPAIASYEVNVNETFVGPVTLSIEGLPPGLEASFDETVINPGGATQMNVFGTENVPQGTYTFTLNGTDGTNESNQTLTLNVLVGAPATTTLLTPANMAIDQFTGLQLTWEDQLGSDSYEVELATDPGFSNIIATATDLGDTNFQASNLATLTTYYWHVRSTNICGTGDWSETFEFTTAAINCSLNTALTEGITIGPQGGTVTTSALMIDQDGEIADVKITNFSTNHTWVGDIDMTLIAPSGTMVQVFNRPNCDEPGMLVSFSDDATQTPADFEASCSGGGVAITGEFQPADPFSIFAGEQATGEWRLEITDNANGDEGDLLGWILEVCTLLPSEGILTTSQSQVTTCIGNTATVEVTVGEGFNDEVTLSATNLPAGATATFEANPVAPGSTVSVTLDNLTVDGTFGIGFDGTDGAATASTTVNLEVVAAPALSSLLQPLDGGMEDADNPIGFTWEAVADADSYVVEIATDDTFLNIVDSDEVETPEYTTDLDPGQYYWRVTTFNDCGESITEFFVFTAEIINAVVEINGAQVSIWPNPTQGPLQISLTGELNNDLRVSVLSVQGQELRQERFSARTGIQQMDLSDLPAGAYLLRLTSGQAGQMLRIIVQ